MDYKNYFSEVNKFIMDAKRGLCNNSDYKLKWKSMVIRYIKVLSDIKPDDIYFNQSTDLLYRIFMILEEAKNGLIFITSNPFKDINNDEVELYKKIIDRYFINFDESFMEKLFMDTIDISILNKRFVLWAIYIYANKIKEKGLIDNLYKLIRDIYKKYYKEFKKKNIYQLLIEYMLYNMVVVGFMTDNIKLTVNNYYSMSIIDKEDAFDALFDIASVFDDKRLLIYSYDDALARRIKVKEYQTKEFDSFRIK